MLHTTLCIFFKLVLTHFNLLLFCSFILCVLSVLLSNRNKMLPDGDAHAPATHIMLFTMLACQGLLETQ